MEILEKYFFFILLKKYLNFHVDPLMQTVKVNQIYLFAFQNFPPIKENFSRIQIRLHLKNLFYVNFLLIYL